jgi:hypothetical protein
MRAPELGDGVAAAGAGAVLVLVLVRCSCGIGAGPAGGAKADVIAPGAPGAAFTELEGNVHHIAKTGGHI